MEHAEFVIVIVLAAIIVLIFFLWSRTTARISTTTPTPPTPDESSSPYDVIVIGGGVCGSSLAAVLGRQGKRVLILESSMEEPDRIVGELMQPRGIQTLGNLGLKECVEGIDAKPVTGYAIYFQDKHFTAPYPNGAFGMGFHNGRFVMKLRRAAEQVPTVTMKEATVSKIVYDSQDNTKVLGVAYTDKDTGSEVVVHAPLTVLAAGCLTGFRKALIKQDSKHTISRFLGFVLEDCESPYEGTANVLLGDPTPTLCYPVGTRELRVLVDFTHERANLISGDRDKLNDHLLNNVMPYFPPTMQQSFKNAVAKGKFMSMPNQSMTAIPRPELSGIALIGDALNMRHPLTGGGMTVGLKDVEILSNILADWKPLHSTKTVDYSLKQKLVQFYTSRRQPNAVINMLADALYCVFSQKYADLRSSCFSYLERGGFYLAGPISFLGGISESQSFLLYHFFAVAVYSVRLLLLASPSVSNLGRSYRALRDAVHIIHPLVERSATDLSLVVSVNLLRALFQ